LQVAVYRNQTSGLSAESPQEALPSEVAPRVVPLVEPSEMIVGLAQPSFGGAAEVVAGSTVAATRMTGAAEVDRL